MTTRLVMYIAVFLLGYSVCAGMVSLAGYRSPKPVCLSDWIDMQGSPVVATSIPRNHSHFAAYCPHDMRMVLPSDRDLEAYFDDAIGRGINVNEDYPVWYAWKTYCIPDDQGRKP
jgi:hypothetical protein